MINIFLLIHSCISWKYPTFDELDAQCGICQYITHRFENDTFEIDLQIIPLKGTICATDKNNDICQVTEAIAKNFKNATNKTNYCRRTGLCPAEIPSGYVGQKCQICIMLSKHILHYQEKDRKIAFHNFCNTSNLITSLLCGDIYDESVDDYLDDIEDIKKTLKFCEISHFCRKDPKYTEENEYNTDEL